MDEKNVNLHHHGAAEVGEEENGIGSSDCTSEDEVKVRVGDTFKSGQYVVQSKLGSGFFSTVWLAWDTL